MTFKRFGFFCGLLFVFSLASAWGGPAPLRRKAAAAFQAIKTEPLYRFRSRKGYLLYKTGAGLPGGLTDGPWKSEGVVCHVPNNTRQTKPLYELMKADDYAVRYAYTNNTGAAQGGWQLRGVAFYVAAEQLPGTVPLYQLHLPPRETDPGKEFSGMVVGTDAYLYTASASEKAAAQKAGWRFQEVVGYVWPSPYPPPAAEMPDLSVRQVEAEEFSVRAVVFNGGKANTGGAHLYAHLLLYDKAGKTLFSDGKYVGGMSPGQSQQVVFETGGRSLVGLRYQVKVDLADAVREADESNNVTAPAEFRRKLKINSDPGAAGRVPVPSIALTGVEANPAQGRPKRTRYRLTISNADAYRPDWFQSLRGKLPPNPCGDGMTDARMLLRFTVERGGQSREVGCKPLGSPQEMRNVAFDSAEPLADSDRVRVTLEDRADGARYESGSYAVGWFGLGDVLTTVGCKSFLGRAGSYLCTTDKGMSVCENLRVQGKPVQCTRAGKAQD